MAVDFVPKHPPDSVCANCATPLAGDYCHACGQKHSGPGLPTVGSYLRNLATEIAQLDFKSLHDAAYLLRPGHLTAEYLAGRRERHLSPLKIYLLCAALFFMAAPYVFGFSLEQQLAQEGDGTWLALVDARLAATGTSFEMFAASFADRVRLLYTLSLGISVIADAVILRLLFGRTAPAFGVHLVFALHYVAFFYLAALVVNGLNQLLHHPEPWILFGAQYALLGPYAYLAMKRVYCESAGRTALKCGAMLVVAMFLDAPVQIWTMRLAIALA